MTDLEPINWRDTILGGVALAVIVYGFIWIVGLVGVAFDIPQ